MICRDAGGDEHPACDLGSGTDHRVATKDRRAGVNDDIVLEYRVPLTTLDDPTLPISREASSPESHALIELAPCTDPRRR